MQALFNSVKLVPWTVNFSAAHLRNNNLIHSNSCAIFATTSTLELNKFMATNLLINPVKLRFYTERYGKEEKLINVRDTFVPTTRTKPLIVKFYAKHDVFSPSDVREDDVNLIKRQMEMIPKDVYSFRPPAVNMEYGWFTVPLVPLTKDPRLRFSRKQSDFIASELVHRKLQRGLPEKRFAGVPFRT